MPTGNVVVYMHVFPDSYSSNFIHESKWAFVADDIKFPSGISEI